MCKGESSDMYIGSTKEIIPIPMPVKNLAIISIIMNFDVHASRDPITTRMLLKIRIGFLPMMSENGPAAREPKIAPAIESETMNS